MNCSHVYTLKACVPQMMCLGNNAETTKTGFITYPECLFSFHASLLSRMSSDITASTHLSTHYSGQFRIDYRSMLYIDTCEVLMACSMDTYFPTLPAYTYVPTTYICTILIPSQYLTPHMYRADQAFVEFSH